MTVFKVDFVTWADKSGNQQINASARGNEHSLDMLKKRQKERQDELANMTAPMKKVSIYLDRWVQQNIKSEGGNVGGWQPFALGGRLLSDGTIDPSAQLLQDTGRLRASFLPFATNDDAGIGSDLGYSEGHHVGTGRLPERRLLPKPAEVMQDVRKLLSDFVFKAIE